MKYFTWIAVFVVGAIVGMSVMSWAYRTNFEAISGVNWHSFNAAHDDCVVSFKEECKIFGGFAPKSQFR